MDWHGDDIEPEDVAAAQEEESGEQRAEEKLAKLRDELAACRKEKQEYMDGWQRAKADYVNALKRFEADTKTAQLRGRISAVEVLLPAFDALERAKEHGELPAGFVAIAKQMENAFASLGLLELGREGERFDPALHEALGQDRVESEDEDELLTAVLEKGWRLGDTVIRPAKVRVGHFTNEKREA